MRIFLALLTACSLFAQEDPRLAPKELPQSEGKIKPFDLHTDKITNGEKVLIPELKGLIFVGSPKLVCYQKVLRKTSDSIVVDGLNVPKERRFKEKMTTFIGKPVTPHTLNAIRQETIDFYQCYGYPVVGVSIPAGQDVTDGHLFVLVLVAKLGEVKVEGVKWGSSERLKNEISLSQGDDIETKPLLEDLNWLNNNPFRNVDLIYEKGESLGETDVLLHVEDRFPVRIYGGYENTGNIIAGDSRYLSGINIGNLWGLNHQLNYQWMSASHTKKWWGNSANYIAPLPWRHTFKAFGSYVRTGPGLTEPQFPDAMTQNGKGWQVGGRYIIPLPSFSQYFHEMRLGYDFKRTNNFLSFSKTLIFDQFFDISQFLVGYDGTYEGTQGVTLVGLTLFISPGKMTKYNNNKSFNLERAGAKSSYIYGRLTADRIQRLPLDFSWILSTQVQLSSAKLLPSEELSLGGYLSVRGYDENEIVSDQGLIIKNEFRSPPLSFIKKKKYKDELQFLVFIDFGYANDIDQNIFSRNNTVLASIGPGVRYHIQEYLSFRFDYGFQIHDLKNRPFASKDTSRMHLGLIVGY